MKFKAVVSQYEYDKIVKVRNILKKWADARLKSDVVFESFSAKRLIDANGKDTGEYDVTLEIRIF